YIVLIIRKMISKSLLKNIIISNEQFIDRSIKEIVPREGIFIPEPHKTIIFYGVRRSGKTFILFDLFKRYRDRSLYIDFEDERLSGFDSRDFKLLTNLFFELRPELIQEEPIFLLDEIHHIKGWEKFCIKGVGLENIKVFLSCSSPETIPKEIHTAIRGRPWSIEVLPFSFKELLRVKGIDTHDMGYLNRPEGIEIKSQVSEYLIWGGFPEVWLVKSEFERKKLLKEYFNAIFFRDLIERFEITNINLLENLLDKLFSSFSTKISLNSFYKQYKEKFPFSKDMLFKYYKYILQSMLIFEVRIFSDSTYKRMRNPAKIYSIDTGLCRKITSDDFGRLLENAIFLELKRKGLEIFYFEDKRECDFITKSPSNRFMAVQVAFELNDENNELEIGGLLEACKFLGIKEGFIITNDQERELKIDGINVHAIPAWKWMIS
ncbi:MAG: ATP-binding protein, partial [Thermodesulfobacteriota bacterium]